jgi:hypothetical protein
MRGPVQRGTQIRRQLKELKHDKDQQEKPNSHRLQYPSNIHLFTNVVSYKNVMQDGTAKDGKFGGLQWELKGSWGGVSDDRAVHRCDGPRSHN